MSSPQNPKPKTVLDRTTVQVPTLDTSYIQAESNGKTIFANKSVPNLTKTTEFGTPFSSPVGQETMYHSGLCEFVLDTLPIKDIRMPESFNFEIDECMDKLYRTGQITFVTNNGLVEHSGLINTFEGEKLAITLKSRHQDDEGRVINFGLYDMQTDPENLVTTYSLFEEPFFTLYHKQAIGKSYSDINATDIISRLISSEKITSSINKRSKSDDPKMASFIVPCWSASTTVAYLSQYSKYGPIKTFNVSVGQKTVTMIAPLSEFMNAKVYPSSLNNFEIIPSITENVENAIKLGPYKIFGVNNTDITNNLSGETVISFDHLGDLEQECFMFEDSANYEFSSKYKNKKRFMSTLGGNFEEGTKLASSPLGSQAFHNIKSKSKAKQLVTMDADDNKLSQAKMITRFFQSFHDEVMLYTILPGISFINVGQVFDITIPSVDQSRRIGSTPIIDETLSGKWLLWKINHKVTMMAGGRPKYEMHCYFLRTGYNIAPDFRKADTMKRKI